MTNVFKTKDEKLHYLCTKTYNNIARFVSVSPKGYIRYVYIDENYKSSGDLKIDILQLLDIAPEKSVNIRSFKEDSMKSNRFIYGKKKENINEIMELIKENCENGLYSIINETIDVSDGGVSGVMLNNTIEFAPNDTPRCVEKEGVCKLERTMGNKILNIVYGFEPKIDFNDNVRVEFSIHPKKQGYKNTHTIIWEFEDFAPAVYDVKINFPNKFSQFLGDKVFGLLIADSLGFKVPYTTVILRNVPPFSFGKKTNSYEKWIRTAPIIKEPGKYYSGSSWCDPFILMNTEEQKGKNNINIGAILSQSAVNAMYSGGAIVSKHKNDDLIEATLGEGDDFMLGTSGTYELPAFEKNHCWSNTR